MGVFTSTVTYINNSFNEQLISLSVLFIVIIIVYIKQRKNK